MLSRFSVIRSVSFYLQAAALNESTEYPTNGHVNGLDADDSDSEFISVSAQQTPRIQRKYLPNSQQPRQTPSSGAQHRDVQLVTATSSQSLQRDVACSAQDLCKPPPYRRHGYANGYSNHHSNGYTPRWEVREGNVRERRNSGESFVDAYGLVIHGHDRGGNRGWSQDQEGSQGVYSNWKLQYFSTPNISRTLVDGEKGVQNRNGQDPTKVTNGQGASDGDHSEVHENRPEVLRSQSDLWHSNYPFNKRALYRGHENVALVGRGDTTLPLRSINSPPTLVENGRDEKVKKEKLLHTPDPDYTPPATPRGSTRSLNTEIARVLRDFENTLRAHELSRSPSVVEVGPVAFV